MFSAILLVALGTVSGHKCHGYAVCSSPCSCSAPVVVSSCYASSCSCTKVRRHKCGLFKKLFHKNNCCSSSCSASTCCSASAYSCSSSCSGTVIESSCSCSAPAEAAPAAPAAEPAPATPAPPAPEAEKKDSAGFRVDRSSLVAVSFKLERAEFQDEPIVIFARN